MSENSGLKSEPKYTSAATSDISSLYKSSRLKRRPINLNFFTLHFPVTAWVSILHRLSGLFVFLLIPGLLWMLQESLASETRFHSLGHLFHAPFLKLVVWLLLSALFYHLIAGCRHVLMDLHIGTSKIGGRRSAWIVLFISVLGFLFLGIWIGY